jgi:hypothetical protein
MMKHLPLRVIILLILCSMVVSCKKDKAAAEKFSTLSVEENKANVEDAGINFVDVLNQMQSIETIDVIVNLGDIISSSGGKGKLFLKDSKFYSALETFKAAAMGEKRLNDLFHEMASPRDLNEDAESIQEFWNNNTGTYSWNPDISDFDFVSGGNTIIILFPSSDLSGSNDATITFYNYAGVNISNPIDDDYTGDLPVSLNVELKRGSNTLITYIYSASYNSDGVPNAIASDLTIENFKFEVDISNDTKVVSVNYKFIQDGNVVMNMGAEGKGLFTQANYDSNTTTHTDTYSYINYVWNPVTEQYDPIEVFYTDEWEETDFEEILNSANAHFELFNVAIRGDINVKDLVDQLKIIDDQDIDDETANNSYAEKINEYMNLRLVNTTNNEIMAKTEAYVVNEIGNGYTDSYIDFKLTFSDESAIAIDTYFNNGFDDFVNELNSFINNINSDHDLDIDPVEYK